MPKPSWREFNDPLTHNQPNLSSPKSQKGERSVRVQKTRSGKAGKTVTWISGLELDPDQLKILLKRLKASCGTGGTIKGVFLELQGDHVKVVLELLTKDGFRPKQSGG